MDDSKVLEALAGLIEIRNIVDDQISRLIDRPSNSGHIAEFVASEIFDIELNANAATRAIDGTIRSGKLAGKSVNIKYGSRRDGNLNLVSSFLIEDHPDLYLVMTGPNVGPVSSRGSRAPWCIHEVFVFDPKTLLDMLTTAQRVPGIATSIRAEFWHEAMIFPEQQNPLLELTERQRQQLRLFHFA